MEADELMTRQQDDLFIDVPHDADLVGPDATVHDLLRAKGRRGAAAYAFRTAPEVGRRAPMDILAGSRGSRIIAVAADTNEATGALGSAASAAGHVYSGWCMLGLPYRRPKGEKDQVWRITTDFADITVQSGTIKRDDGTTELAGVPYGSYARMALIALQSEALEQGARDIELGETAYDALKRLGLPDVRIPLILISHSGRSRSPIPVILIMMFTLPEEGTVDSMTWCRAATTDG